MNESRTLIVMLLTGPFLVAPSRADDVADEAPPRTLILDGEAMHRNRSRLNEENSFLLPALAELEQDADQCLNEGPWTVVSKELTPPSGDKHDYMSVGPYWWPDPDQPDGLPYIRRDGEVNPERRNYDNVGMGQTARNSHTLALAWYYTRNPAYAEHAAELLRTWFLAPETRMNPNLNYGQAIPGRTDGRGIGIIDSVCLIDAVDAAILLEHSPAWSEDDAAGLRAWFGGYLDWLRTSPHGVDEDQTENNHATWYDAQVACFAIYAEQPELAREVLAAAAERRIATQIQPDGRQPHELARTKSWDYSVMNLRGFFTMATLAEHVDVDLWTYESEAGGSIRGALNWLLPFALGMRDWEHQQISRLSGERLAELLRRAALVYDAPAYEAALADIVSADELARQRFQLTLPAGDSP